MNPVFADTSGFLALLTSHDVHHDRAQAVFERLQARQAVLVTTSYVLVETCALLGRRMGLAAVADFRDAIMPILDPIWVDRPLHDAGLDWLLAQKRRRLSLVDAVSFVIMRRRQLLEAFAFDQDFEREGFTLPA